MIDLHMHSNMSDGSLSPEALAGLLSECGVSVAALTDHDTMEGVPRFMDACARLRVAGIAGVEISAEVQIGTMHILGYFGKPPEGEFMHLLAKVRNGRDLRNQRILETLEALGMPIGPETLACIAGNGVAGRPHIAQAMVQKGYVADMRAAFDAFLGKGKPAYHDRFRLEPADAIRAIRSAGGAAVLAHPFTLDLPVSALRCLIRDLAGAGLSGVEAIYPEHPEPLRQLYTTLALECGLAVTGGSDFHGALNPAIRPGRGFGNIRVPVKVLSDLELSSGVTFPRPCAREDMDGCEDKSCEE